MANMFRYSSNIVILEDPVAYRREVVKYLELIQTTYTGRLLVRYVNARSKLLTIVPYVPAKEAAANGYLNAYALQDDWQGSVPSGAPLLVDYYIAGYGSVALPNGWFGKGGGSTVTLKYHPAMWRQLTVNRGGHVAPGDGPGEVLFHEMLHAMRMIHGQVMRTTVTEDLHFDDFEEFCAILGANMYRSERGFKQLRANHAGSAALTGPDATSAGFADKFGEEIKRWFNGQRHFCIELAGSQAAFNPMRVVAQDMGVDIPTPMAL